MFIIRLFDNRTIEQLFARIREEQREHYYNCVPTVIGKTQTVAASRPNTYRRPVRRGA